MGPPWSVALLRHAGAAGLTGGPSAYPRRGRRGLAFFLSGRYTYL